MVGVPSTTWITALLVFFAVALGTISVALVVELLQERKRQRDALRQLRAFTNDEPEQGGILRLQGNDLPRWFRPIAARVPAVQDLELMMEQAGMNGHVPLFLMSTIGLTIGMGLALLAITRWWPAALAASFIGAVTPYMVVRYRRNKRLNAFEEMLPEAIDLLGRAIRAGHPLSAGIRMVSEEAPDPVAGEFRQVFEEQRFGLPFEDALLALSDRNELVDVRIFVTAVLTQREAGGNTWYIALTEVRVVPSDRARSAMRAADTVSRRASEPPPATASTSTMSSAKRVRTTGLAAMPSRSPYRRSNGAASTARKRMMSAFITAV